MSKRSDQFERKPRDLYPTPEKAVGPLLPHLPNQSQFDEPCAGNGELINHLEAAGHVCAGASDIHPMSKNIDTLDALNISECHGDLFITNSPWPQKNGRGEPVLSLIIHLSGIAPTWLLLPADFAHNAYFSAVACRCQKIVSVGRVKWIKGSKHTGKDNAAWYLFDKPDDGLTAFYGRAVA